MNRRNLVSAASLFAVVLVARPVMGQVATALVREGGELPGGPIGHTINSINNPATNQLGGYSVNVNTSDGVNTISRFWGHATGGTGALMRSEGVFPPYTQTAWESFYGLSDGGSFAYSPTVTGGPVASADSVWLDDTPVAIQGLAHPTLAGQFWSFGSRPGVTAGGIPYFGGGITTTVGGATQNRGLFYGLDGGTVLYLGGQTPPNLPRALSGTTINFDFRMSANGTNWIAPVSMIAPTADDATILVNGSGLLVAGALVQEATPIPAAAGGLVGENWANFDSCGINEAGDYFFTGDSNLATTADEFIFKNGMMLYRDGMTLDGETVQGDIEAAYMNENGDIAFIWDIQLGVLEALYLNDDLLIKEGDLVDLDGDGIVEPNSVLRDFTGIASLAISPRIGGMVDVYFTADIDVNGTPSTLDDIEAFFRIRATIPAACLRGDVNDDATVDYADVAAFVAVALDPGAATPQQFCASDVNQDGSVDGHDADDMAACVIGGGCP